MNSAQNVCHFIREYLNTVNDKLPRKYWSHIRSLHAFYMLRQGEQYPITPEGFETALRGEGARILKGKVNQVLGLC